MNGHTPGPWKYQEESDSYTHIVRAGGNRFLCQFGQSTKGEEEANARLVAAAPGLLEELECVGRGLAEVMQEGAFNDPVNTLEHLGLIREAVELAIRSVRGAKP